MDFHALILAVIILLFLLVIVVMIVFWQKDRVAMAVERTAMAVERKDLYDRLMSKDLTQYKDNLTLPEETEAPPVLDTMDLEDAKAELLPEDSN